LVQIWKIIRTAKRKNGNKMQRGESLNALKERKTAKNLLVGDLEGAITQKCKKIWTQICAIIERNKGK
jgi:hypothetical protein